MLPDPSLCTVSALCSLCDGFPLLAKLVHDVQQRPELAGSAREQVLGVDRRGRTERAADLSELLDEFEGGRLCLGRAVSIIK